MSVSRVTQELLPRDTATIFSRALTVENLLYSFSVGLRVAVAKVLI